MRSLTTRLLLLAALAPIVATLATPPVMAYCRDCDRYGCYDVNPGVTGYSFCDSTGGQCRRKNWGCTGFSGCWDPTPGACTDHDGMLAPGAAIVLIAGHRGLDLIGVSSEMCLAPAAPVDSVIR